VRDGKTNHIGGGIFTGGSVSASRPSTVVAPHPAATSTVVATNLAATFNGGSPSPSGNVQRWQSKTHFHDDSQHNRRRY